MAFSESKPSFEALEACDAQFSVRSDRDCARRFGMPFQDGVAKLRRAIVFSSVEIARLR